MQTQTQTQTQTPVEMEIEKMYDSLVEKLSVFDYDYYSALADAVLNEILDEEDYYVEFYGVGIVATLDEIVCDYEFYRKVVFVELLLDRL